MNLHSFRGGHSKRGGSEVQSYDPPAFIVAKTLSLERSPNTMGRLVMKHAVLVGDLETFDHRLHGSGRAVIRIDPRHVSEHATTPEGLLRQRRRRRPRRRWYSDGTDSEPENSEPDLAKNPVFFVQDM